MKKLFKSAVAVLSCALCITACVLFAGCGTDFKSFYSDPEEIWSRYGDPGVDCTFSDYELTGNTSNLSVSGKGFSGIKTIHDITVEPGRENSVFYLEFTEFRMTKGKLKIYLTRTESVWDVFSHEFTSEWDGLLAQTTLYSDDNLTGEADKYLDEHMKGYWDVKIVGVDADFDFKLQFKTEKDASGSENPPVDPDPPKPSSSNFEKIKTNYENAGYTVDLSSDSVDASMKQLIDMMNGLYGQLGYGLCYIGKNLNDALSAEMYMLISTDSEETTAEFARGFDGKYQYRVKGKDIIVYIWTMGTPNFAPFNQAVA